ncbi:DUF6754 domain-containing protein [candidate division CSSED10-310 bacterium]|uniref:DUF6754 domain-containing protein n=1 Tax=candidate division CSSED10-310 bacterium TaxID=2855610 RepID=A0ABV6YV02_UNCC1
MNISAGKILLTIFTMQVLLFPSWTDMARADSEKNVDVNPESISQNSSKDKSETEPVLVLPKNIRVMDLPNDGGDAVLITWQVIPEAKTVWADWEMHLYRAQQSDGDYTLVGSVKAGQGKFEDHAASDGTEFYYKVEIQKNEHKVISDPFGPVVAAGSWFDTNRINALVFLIVFSVVILYFIGEARRGKDLYIRKVTGLAAVDEAVGRATEMGRKILYIPGIAEISEIQTVAGLSILGHIAKTAAEYSTRILVPNMDPLTYAVARELVQESYLSVGKPEAFREEDVFFITSAQFAYTAAVTGLMVREKPAANFFIGWFKAESLLLAETGQATGAIQIAGTAELDQLPFFVATCDYTLIGEELYAASAYMTRQPLLLGSIKGQDIAKAILIGVLIIGLATHFFDIDLIRNFLTMK